MCKHILNAQVAIRSICCKRWFDCAECHEEHASHPLRKSDEMTFACKKCRKCFRRDVHEFEEDEAAQYCPHCDNHFLLPAEGPLGHRPPSMVEAKEGEFDPRMLRDERLHVMTRMAQTTVDDAFSDRIG